jgi:putative protein-disulfide isomerase
MNKLIVTLLFLTMISTISTAQKPELIYVGDPMCSWCYGFSGELKKIKEKYADKLDFKILVGGLRPDETQYMDAAMKRFLEHHWKQVNKASGREFSYEILKRNDFIYNTKMTCKAVLAFDMLNKNNTYHFFFELQKAFYFENLDVTLPENCAKVAERFSVNKTDFLKNINSIDAENATINQFKEANQMGATGFPTVFLKKDGKLIKLCEGFEKFEKLDAKIEGLLK